MAGIWIPMCETLTECCFVAQVDLEFMSLLPLPSMFWNYSLVKPCLVKLQSCPQGFIVLKFPVFLFSKALLMLLTLKQYKYFLNISNLYIFKCRGPVLC